jgi:hypothetical protein
MAPPGIPQTASGVVRVADREGLDGLRRTLNCSRRQAEQVLSLARRALQRGEILTADDIPINTVAKAEARRLPIPEPAPLAPEEEAQARARAIRALPPSDRTRTLGDLEGKAATMKRSLAAGYPEWRHELAITERVIALVNNPIAAGVL